MTTTGTAVVLPEIPENAIEQLRQRGAAEVAIRKEMTKIYKQIEGAEWGAALSKNARAMIAELCQITKANPMLHINILGGKPDLNAKFWADLAANHPAHVRHEQRDLSPSVDALLRQQAQRHFDRARPLPDGAEKVERLARAFALEEQADAIERDRAGWSPRETATAVVETTVYRYTNQAMALLAQGKVPAAWEIVAITECNWAGGFGVQQRPKKNGGAFAVSDPIGDADPGKTARTRSLRRTLEKAYSAWMGPYSAQLQKVEEYMEAEFTIVEDARPRGASLHIGAGQPERADEHVDEQTGEVITQAAATQAELPTTEAAAGDTFDYDDARKKLMATFTDAGLKGEPRKAWMAEHGLPDSVTKFTPDDYRRAWRLMVDPVREQVTAMAGDGLEDLALSVLKKAGPEYLRDWKLLLSVLENQRAGEAEGEAQQGDAFPGEL